jgi:hypothetical protein
VWSQLANLKKEINRTGFSQRTNWFAQITVIKIAIRRACIHNTLASSTAVEQNIFANFIRQFKQKVHPYHILIDISDDIRYDDKVN